MVLKKVCKTIILTGPSKGSTNEGEWKNDKQMEKVNFFVTPDGKQHWYGEGFFVDGYLEGQCTFK